MTHHAHETAPTDRRRWLPIIHHGDLSRPGGYQHVAAVVPGRDAERAEHRIRPQIRDDVLDEEDDRGRDVGAGVYFLLSRGGGHAERMRVVVLR